MAQSSRRIIQGLGSLHFNKIPSGSSSPNRFFSYLVSTNHNSFAPHFSNSRNLTSEHSKPCFREFQSKPTSANGASSQNFSLKHHSYTPVVGFSLRNYSCEGFPSRISNSRRLNPEISSKLHILSSSSLGFSKLNGNSSGCRSISFKSSDSSKINGNFSKTFIDKPLSAFQSVFGRYRDAVGLQIEAFWNRNFLVILGAVGVGLCIMLWRFMFGIANTFIGISEGMAKYGFLALSTAIVAFAGLYVRSRYTINPDRVYRMAMRKLNTSAGILEVMGAPLSGTELRAYVMSGGGIGLKNFKPRLRYKRCFLIFPIRGSERKGLVSVEVKKKKGQYDMKMLAVDVPMATGPDQRLFLIGDEMEYKVGGGLISELRDPLVKAMSAEKEFEVLDLKEEEEDAERELQEAEQKHKEEIGKLERGSS